METCLVKIVHKKKRYSMLTWIHNEAVNDQQIKEIF